MRRDVVRAQYAELVERTLAELGWEGEVVWADTFFARLFGMFAASLASAQPREVLLVFPRCSSVHTWFMGVPLDIAFADSPGEVLAVHCAVGPWQVLSHRRASLVIERVSRHEAWEVGASGCVAGGARIRASPS